MRILFFGLIVVPILELAIFIAVGQKIGAFATIALVFLTAAVGYALIKLQGAEALKRAREKIQKGQTPASEIAEGLFLVVGGALLLTPGFITDSLGFFCLVPGLRALLVAWGVKRFIQMNTQRRSSPLKGNTIEGEYRREDS